MGICHALFYCYGSSVLDFVEVLGRWNIFHEIWVEPMAYTTEMITILLAFLALLAFLFYQSAKKKNSHN